MALKNPTAWAVMFLMLAVAPVLCTWLGVMWRRRFPSEKGGGTGEPVCGACRYPVRGLSTFTCPECGADLRDVGIIKTGASNGGLRWTITAWTIMWAALTFLTIPMLEAIVGARLEPWIGPTVAWGIIGWFAGLVYLLRVPADGSMATGTSGTSGSTGAFAPGISGGALSRAAQPPTPSKPVTRNLSIMFIDIVEFTRLASDASRDGVISLIQGARELVQPVITQHQGRIVKTMGDGFLATFESPTQAVMAGRAVQIEAARAGSGNGEPLQFRVGVTTGEVAIADDDVFGDAVNLAARLQQLAGPGQVHFSASTWHAMKRSEVPHEEAGDFDLKGVPGMVKVYRAM